MATHYLYPVAGATFERFRYRAERKLLLQPRSSGEAEPRSCSEYGDPFTPGRSDALVCSPGKADITGENRRLTIDQ